MTSLATLRRIGSAAAENTPMPLNKGGTGGSYASVAALVNAGLGVTPGAFGLTLLDDANQAAGQVTLGYTAADVLAKLLTVDGAASGLDADTLDSYHASAFGRLADTATQTWSGGHVFAGLDLSTSGVATLNIISSGTTLARVRLQNNDNARGYINYDVKTMRFFVSNAGNTAEVQPLLLDAAGAYPGVASSLLLGGSSLRWSNVYSVDGNFSGAITGGSDARIKRHIQDLGPAAAWAILNGLRPRTFIKNGQPVGTVGFVAQEIGDPRYVHGIEGDLEKGEILTIPAGSEWAAPLVAVARDLDARLRVLEAAA